MNFTTGSDSTFEVGALSYVGREEAVHPRRESSVREEVLLSSFRAWA